MTMHDEDVAERGGLLPRLPLVLYALTIFLSAFLLFQVQPIIGKIILPWFGGSAAVWTTCLLFFQIVLLLGYLYAHGVIRYVPTKWQPRLHVVLLVVSLLALHMIPSPTLRPHGGDEPVGRILLVLLLTIGLPYFLLSTTSPLLQAWFDAYVRTSTPSPVTDATTDVPDAPTPKRTFAYRLYALSNTGSLLALLSYPLCVEPYLTLRQQSLAWSIGYTSFVLLGIFVAWKFRSGKTERATTEYTEKNAQNANTALRSNDPIPTNSPNTQEYPTTTQPQNHETPSIQRKVPRTI